MALRYDCLDEALVVLEDTELQKSVLEKLTGWHTPKPFYAGWKGAESYALRMRLHSGLVQMEVLPSGTLFVVAVTGLCEDTVEGGLNSLWTDGARTVQAIMSKRPSVASLALASHKRRASVLPSPCHEADGINMIGRASPLPLNTPCGRRTACILHLCPMRNKWNKAQTSNVSVQVSS